ncbi:hypothetical protein Tco_1031352 [Tanacetum coccineum]|uniref:Reverse transcriptase Ty1/copia-type domain-containing protein n=1 Tax=Tanacetum coccineum TaxID=301880 RepID=A0ABQ5G941_9ASTR
MLLAIPDEYLLKFHNVPDAKSLWAAIKSRFGGNEESKKMQKNVLKHQAYVSKEDINQKFLRSLPPSWSQIALIMRNKPDIDEIDIDDLYNNLRVYEDEMKKSSTSSSNTQNLAFLSSENTNSTKEVSTASGDIGVSTAGEVNQALSTPCAHDIAYSFLAQPTTSPQLENEDFQQMDGDDLEELDLRWQVAMLTVRVKKKGHFARECRSGRSQGRRSYGDNGRSNAPTNESSSQALVAQDGLGGYDWSNDFEVEPVNYALMAISSSSSSSSSDSEVQKCSKCLESFKCLQKNYDTEREKHNKAKLEIRGYEIALESLESRILRHEKNELAWGEKYEFQNYELKCREIKINNLNLELEKAVKERDELKDKIAKWEGSSKNLTKILNRNFLTPRADISFAGLDEYAIRKKIIESKTTDLNTKTSETVGKTNEANTQKPKTVYESVNRDKVIIEDWNSDDEDDVSEVQTVSPVKTNETQTVKTRVDKIGQTSQKQGIGFKKIKACFVCKSTDHLIKDCNFHDKQSQEPKLKTVVNTGPRVDKPVWDNTKRVNHQKFSKYPHLRKTFVPSGVLTRTGLITPVKQNEKRAVHTVSTARPVSTVRPFAPKIAQTGGAIRPIYPRMDNVRPRGSYSPIKRSYYTKPAFRPKDLKQDVKTFGVQNMTTVGTRAVVNTGKGKMDTDLKKSRWVWRPKGNYLDHVSKDSGSFMLKKGNPEILLQDHAVVDSSCSSHMTATKLIFQTMKITMEALWLLEVIPKEVQKLAKASFVYLGEKNKPLMTLTQPNADLPIDPNMPDLEDDSDAFSSDGIFNGAYDDENVGAVADFNNMDDTINVSPIPTLRIHKNHPKDQILGDPKSAVQTRGKIQKASSAQQALVSYISKQNRTNHKDHQNCLLACFLSQEEPKNISQALQDESWVEAMQEELLQFKLQKVWILVDLPSGKKAIGTKTATTPIESNKPLVKDEDGEDVDVHVYRSMIGSLMYLTASRPDIMFAVCACARFQVTPKASHLNAVKRIFRYLKHQPKLGLWYPRDSPFELEAFSDSDYGGASLDRKSTTEYVASANCCGQVLWIQNQMMDYGFNFMNTKIHIDNESTISVIKNLVAHSRTKHIEIRFHFIRDCYEKRLIEVIKIHTDSNVADLLTKGFDVTRFNFLVVSIGMLNL